MWCMFYNIQKWLTIFTWHRFWNKSKLFSLTPINQRAIAALLPACLISHFGQWGYHKVNFKLFVPLPFSSLLSFSSSVKRKGSQITEKHNIQITLTIQKFHGTTASSLLPTPHCNSKHCNLVHNTTGLVHFYISISELHVSYKPYRTLIKFMITEIYWDQNQAVSNKWINKIMS